MSSTTLFLVVGLALIGHLLWKFRPWESRRVLLLRAFLRKWEQDIWESESLRMFLKEHEATRIRHLIKQHEQFITEYTEQMKRSGRNDERAKVAIQEAKDRVESYKQDLRSDIVLHNTQLAKEKMLRAKLEYTRRSINQSPSHDELSMAGLEAEQSEQSEDVAK